MPEARAEIASASVESSHTARAARQGPSLALEAMTPPVTIRAFSVSCCPVLDAAYVSARS